MCPTRLPLSGLGRAGRILGTVSVLFLLSSGVLTAQTNLDFEGGGRIGMIPTGWGYQLGATAVLLNSDCYQGKYCVLLTGLPTATSSTYGYLYQWIPAAAYAGRTIQVQFAVRVMEGPGAAVRLYVRADRANGSVAAYAYSTTVMSSNWRYVQTRLAVPADATQILLCIMNYGTGQVWVDDGLSMGLPNAVPEPPRELTDGGIENLTAFAKALGYVRHFHPSDGTELIDWDAFAAYGVRTVEAATSPEDLTGKLQTLFDPIAPTVRFFPDGVPPALPPELAPASKTDLQFVRWYNYGVFTGVTSTYSSSRIFKASSAGLPAGFEDPAKPFQAAIGRGLSISVPLTVYANQSGTLPSRPSPDLRCCATDIADRATRLGSVILAWNVVQHFSPYLDVVDTNWPAALTAALRTAATDTGPADFFITVSRLWAALKDGHGYISAPLTYTSIPLVWDWVENQLVVTVVKSAAGQSVARGDRILTIDGEPADGAVERWISLLSGATPDYLRYRALTTLARCYAPSTERRLEIEPYAAPGTRKTVVLPCGSDSSWNEPRPNVVQEIEPGILYVDINSLTSDKWKSAKASAAAAKGVIFDLRGYPQTMDYVQQLITDTVSSAHWNIPTPDKPDRVDMPFYKSSWTVSPADPAITGRRVFLTDGRAISYAETVMGIIEAYKLAEIVGGPTAGTNGNINYVGLPGGFQLGFTGMKVLKHDDTQHHGVGIRPTIPAGRTRKGVAEGRDEVLARGIEVVKGPQSGATPAISSVVHGATNATGPVAPGEIVTIHGTNLGPKDLAKTSYDGTGFLGTYAGETRVFFDEIQAPLVYASATQVSAIVPNAAAGTAKVRVEYQLRSSAPVTITVAAVAPGLFGAALNQDGSPNSEANPAARGSIVTLFATGSGVSNPPGLTGRMPRPGAVPAASVTVTIGGQPAAIAFQGEIQAGVLQLNVKVPDAAAAGTAPVVVTIGGTASPAVTIALK